MATLSDVKLLDLVPSSLTSDPEIQNICGAVQAELDLLTTALDEVKTYSNIANLPEAALDLMAWGFNLSATEGWALADTIERKRAMLGNALILHKTKGTLASIMAAGDALGVRFEIIEWFDYSGDPGTFRVRVLDSGGRGVDMSSSGQIAGLIDEFKPVSAHYTIEFLLGCASNAPRIGAMATVIETLTVFEGA